MNIQQRPDTSEYGSVDPAPPSDSEQLNELKDILLDEHQKNVSTYAFCVQIKEYTFIRIMHDFVRSIRIQKCASPT